MTTNEKAKARIRAEIEKLMESSTRDINSKWTTGLRYQDCNKRVKDVAKAEVKIYEQILELL